MVVLGFVSYIDGALRTPNAHTQHFTETISTTQNQVP
jgi:hypothetical protein